VAPRFSRVIGLAVGLAAVSLVGPVEGWAQGDGEPGQTPECISHRGEARYRGLGYDHVVVVESACETTALCRVSTDVDPEQYAVEVAPGATEEVMTRRGSPARAFTPRVTCTLR
jgi:hypothetical protein